MSTTAQAEPKPPFRALVGPVIIGHRGGALEAPENTLAAFRHSKKVGADWIELDVTLSADDEVVVIHDDTLDRTTNGAGKVETRKLSELRQLHAGQPKFSVGARLWLRGKGAKAPDFGERFVSERVPSLDEVLALGDQRIMIELKAQRAGRVQRLVEQVHRVVMKHRAADRVAWGSFQTDLLLAAHSRDPSIPVIGIAETMEGVEAVLKTPITVLAVRTDLVAELIETISPNLALWTWTVYTESEAKRVAELGVHGIITDVPQAVIKSLRTPPDLYFKF